jgi:hypothetical protein
MFSNTIVPSLACLLLLNANLIGDETIQSEKSTADEHVSVGSRESDPSKKERMRGMRAQQRENEEGEGKQVEAVETLQRASRKLTKEADFMLAPREMMQRPQIALSSYGLPINCHWLASLPDNRSLEMEDGSHWEVSPSDSYTIRNWRRQDSLIITPNYSWLSSYDYYITNKTNNTYVGANLCVGPTAFGPYSHWIVDIDYFGGHVYLENQMVWCVNPQDGSVLKNWAVNDHVIFGLYDSWFTPYDHILINVNMDDHIRVKQY